MLLGAGCGGGGSDATPTTTVPTITSTTSTASTTTTPERPTSTTTTTYDPASVEGEVEAAYLKSWDVYADAVYNLRLDEAALAEVYADPLLQVQLTEIASRVSAGRAALVRVEHRYRIEMTGADTALVIDRYVNHQVLIDPETKRPTEADPNSTIIDAFSAREIDGEWQFYDLERLS